ncbi:unnamed protein product [Schistosoma turkestanicum]|nr:unnamed protein product [Schistosoma turkestanicum]
MQQTRWSSIFYSKICFMLILLSLLTCPPGFVSLSNSRHPSVEQIFAKVKEAEYTDLLSGVTQDNEPNQLLVVAPVRFSRLRRYYRHQKRMLRAQHRMMRLQRRLYRRHYRPRFGYYPYRK